MAEGIELIPGKDVSFEVGNYVSASDEPWLEFPLHALPKGPGYVQIEYCCGIFDDPVRPILRIITQKETIERALPGPVAGKGICRVYFPKNVQKILISPAARIGSFNFNILSIKRVKAEDIFKEIVMRHPSKILMMTLAYIFGYYKEAINAIDWVINSQSLEEFDAWVAARQIQSKDSINISQGGVKNKDNILIIIKSDQSSKIDLEVTLNSIHQQSVENTVILVSHNRELFPVKWFEKIWVDDAPLNSVKIRELLKIYHNILHLTAGSILHNWTIDIILQELERHKSVDLIYFDEMLNTYGKHSCILKPGWSPIFLSYSNYIGSNFVISASCILNSEITSFLDDPLRFLGDISRNILSQKVVHIRRFLTTKSSTSIKEKPFVRKFEEKSPRRSQAVSIIIPTRDHIDLLRPCIESILQAGLSANDEIIIINNQSIKKQTHKYFTQLEKYNTKIQILHYDQPFNYSAMNNYAAMKAAGDILIFLNNDTQILTPDWIDILCDFASEPNTGAVGACLLFPNGIIQHSGVVIGMGQDAGHFESFQKIDDPSWLSRNEYTHECSAVTAACMAIERSKFEAVSGFDADYFPVEFSDVDLCLRLMSKGLPSLYTPAVKIIHQESATRGGAMMRPLYVYGSERHKFQSRWRSVLRDDPYFHPGLSLYSRTPALSC